MHNLQEIFVNYIHVPMRLQIERYMQRTISEHLIVDLPRSHKYLIGKDGRTRSTLWLQIPGQRTGEEPGERTGDHRVGRYQNWVTDPVTTRSRQAEIVPGP